MKRSDAVFFLSGLAALAYEASWARLAARVLGSQASALALVAALFMGGLALGARAFARPARRSVQPGRLFFALTASSGAFAALSPEFLGALEHLASPTGRLIGTAVCVLVPTLIMGATFPLMGRLTVRESSDGGAESAGFYGANTLGGAVGALVGPLVLTPLLGFSGALRAAGALDLLAGVLAWKLLTAAPTRTLESAEAPVGPGARAATGRALRFGLAAGLLGFAGLGYEVAMVRVLVTVTGTSVYAIALLLGLFLTGLGIGSLQVRERLARPDVDLGQLARRLAFAVPVSAAAGLLLLRFQLGEADLFGSLENRMHSGASLVQLYLMHALLASFCLLLPGLFLGALLPALVGALGRAEDGPVLPVEERLARLYAWNTWGAFLGSLLVGFLLLPTLGPRWSVAVAFTAALLGSLVLPRSLASPGNGSTIRVAAAVLGGLGLMAFALRPAAARDGVTRLHFAHGRRAAIAVEETAVAGAAKPVRSLRVDGKVVATSAPVDLRLQRLLAHLPGLLHGNVESALCIGLGTGMTAGALLDLPTVERLVVVEIEPEVARAAAHFADQNGRVLEDSRTQLRFADGRQVLLRETETFDLVTSDPIHPWTRGSSDLYATEHFERMRARLARGGIASQWLPLYQLSGADVRTVVATWCAVFPHASAWLTAYDLVLVGSSDALPPPAARLLELVPEGRLADSLLGAGVRDGLDLLALWVGDAEDLRRFAGDTPPMGEDRPVLEFRAPLSYLAGYSRGALAWAGRAEFVERLPDPVQPRARALRSALSEFLEALDAGPGAFAPAAARYGEALLPGTR